ncbi:MAG TPA: DUF3027 domain-containing protein [Microlunatus sp.]
MVATVARARAVKPDQVGAEAVELARDAAVEAAGEIGVGEHLGVLAEADRVVHHLFACPHSGYRGWTWSVTLVRAARAKMPTVNEVVLLPGPESLRAGAWIPWAERIQPGDATAGLLMPTPVEDPRLEPGYTGGEDAANPDPAEAGMVRVVVAELGLGRERVLTRFGRDETAERWSRGPSGPDNQLTRQAPDVCETCGFFVRLRGGLGNMFGVCANTFSPSDSSVVSVDHGCGAHSSVIAEDKADELPPPVWETIVWDEPDSLFD